MIEIQDEDTGEVVALLRVIHIQPDFEILGLGIYAAGNDFSKNRKPLKVLRFHDSFDKVVRGITLDVIEKNDGALERDKFLDAYRNEVDSIKDYFSGQAEDPPEGIDWGTVRFPEELREPEKRTPPPAIFMHPHVRM